MPSAGPPLSNGLHILPLLPAVILFAALNSLEEELSYRAPLLATTHEVISRGPSMWLTAVFFGLARTLYGPPAGTIGFIYTGLVAYLFGGSMLETGGSGWAFVMHTIADIPVFLL
ncbi:MAG: CPBP family intramembrane metalloprotease [Chloroflexi bacterium]|nr:CPBP family intramembrane metalloprotease [Chloroflexota bacterium]